MSNTSQATPHWYALRVFQNRTAKLEERFGRQGFATFVPMQLSVSEPAPGKKIEKKTPAVAGLLFVKGELAAISPHNPDNADIPYAIYSSEGRPAPISDGEMERFKIVATAYATGIEYIEPEVAEKILAEGNRVRVKSGIFEGAEGVVKRIKGSKRLVVEIKGVCAVATPYIPAALLESI